MRQLHARLDRLEAALGEPADQDHGETRAAMRVIMTDPEAMELANQLADLLEVLGVALDQAVGADVLARQLEERLSRRLAQAGQAPSRLIR